MTAPRPSPRPLLDGLALQPGELASRETAQAWDLLAAVCGALRGNPRLQGDELYRIFRAEALERFERAFVGMPS